jgi:outer membrane protein assembly factor BamB
MTPARGAPDSGTKPSRIADPGSSHPDPSDQGTIDLGELTPGAYPEPVPAWPTGWRLRHRLARPWQSIAAGALTLIVFALLAGAPAPASPLELRLEFTARYYAIDDTHLYAIAPEPHRGLETRLTAYRLADGGLAWTRDLPGDHGAYHFLGWEGALLLMLLPGGVDPDSRAELLHVDAQTGEVRWRTEGWVEGLLSDTVVLRSADDLETRFDRATELNEGEHGHHYVAIDLDTGAVRWRIGPLSSYLMLARGEPDSLLTLDQQRLVSFDPATGEELLAVAAPGPEAQLQFASGTLAVVRDVTPEQHRPLLYGYDIATLEQRWVSELDTEQDEIYYGYPCGAVFCVMGSGPLRGLDPDTGELRWSADNLPANTFPFVYPQGAGTPKVDYLVVGGHSVRDPQWLVSSATGETLLELSGWRVIPEAMTAAHPVWVVGTPAETITTVGRLREDLSGAEIVGEIHLPTDHCTARSSYLVCGPVPDGGPRDWSVWHLRSGSGG